MQAMFRALPVCLTLLFAACSQPDGAEAVDPADSSGAGSEAAVKDLRSAIASLQASPEHGDEGITLQHILIAFAGASRATVSRTKAEAEALTAEVFAQAKNGADFTALMKEHSTDPGSGTYPMTKKGRAGMVPGFGNVGFRLQVGMIGVAAYHQTDSPFGWHIIKRLK